MIPGPSIQVCQGDKVVVDVENHIEGMEVTIHWHGVWQRGSQYYDGVPYVTQCPIQEGNTFRYVYKKETLYCFFFYIIRIIIFLSLKLVMECSNRLSEYFGCQDIFKNLCFPKKYTSNKLICCKIYTTVLRDL